MRWSEKTDKLLLALAEVQTKVSPVEKNSVNPHFKSNYADLNAVWEMLSPLLAENGLVVTQTGGVIAGKPVLVTRVSDANSSQWVEGEMPLDGGKTDPQGIGAAITYQRRYSLCALFGLMLADDDGNAATPRPQHARQNTPASAQRPAQNRPAPSRPTPPARGAATGTYHDAQLFEFNDKPKGAVCVEWPKGGEKLYGDVNHLSPRQLESAKQQAERDITYWDTRGDEKKMGYVQKDLAKITARLALLSSSATNDEEEPQGTYEDYATSLPSDAHEEPPF